MEEILKAALKVADAADLFWVESRSTPVAFESNRLKHLQTKESRGVGLRIIKDGRIGFSATNRMEDVDGIVSRALEVSPYGAKAEFSLPSSAEHPRSRPTTPKFRRYPSRRWSNCLRPWWTASLPAIRTCCVMRASRSPWSK